MTTPEPSLRWEEASPNPSVFQHSSPISTSHWQTPTASQRPVHKGCLPNENQGMCEIWICLDRERAQKVKSQIAT